MRVDDDDCISRKQVFAISENDRRLRNIIYKSGHKA